MKCISSNPGSGEHHGCPYKTFGEESLTSALGGLQIPGGKVRDIVAKAKAQHYQLACGMTFAALHDGKEIEEGVQHPNQYFKESRKALGFGVEKKEEDGVSAASPVTPGLKSIGGGSGAPVSV
jgi:DNA primase large subunit